MMPERPIRIVDQWMQSLRLYRAARFVASPETTWDSSPFLLGCGLDALTTGPVQET